MLVRKLTVSWKGKWVKNVLYQKDQLTVQAKNSFFIFRVRIVTTLSSSAAKSTGPVRRERKKKQRDSGSGSRRLGSGKDNFLKKSD